MKRKSIKFLKLCLVTSGIFVSVFSYSQKTISGTVMDGSANETLIGSSVQIKGKPVGTVTDIDGKYKIVASSDDVLVFSYIGMDAQEIKVGDKSIINITLQSNSHQLQEVVAIGYGTVKKSDLTGSVSVISTKELTRNPAPSAAQALQGKAAGVLVSSTGAPGGDAVIRVRGVGSLSSNPNPIYIVDGVQLSNITGIQPQDIESLQVLKDASATAIYGANGSNGVIIVTTKRGKSGKVQVNLNTYASLNFAPEQYDMMNAQQYSDFYFENSYKSNGLNKTYTNSSNLTVTNPAYAFTPEFRKSYYGDGWEQGTNWQDQVFKNGLNQNYNLSLAGGGDNSNFSVALGYTNEDGTIIKNSMERFRLRANSDFKISKYIKIGENFSANRSIGEDPIEIQSSMYDLTLSPLMKVYNNNLKGGYETYQSAVIIDGNSYSATLGNDKPNSICAPNLGSNKKYGIGTNASIYMQVDFTDWLMFKVTPSVELVSGKTKYWLPNYEGNRTPGNATLKETYNESSNFNLENQLLFKKNFNKTHNIQATAVYSMRSQHNTAINGAKTGFVRESLNTLTNGSSSSMTLGGSESDYRMLSYLGRVMYDYKGKYYATASFRSDGVSVFAPAYRRGDFYSGSLAWKVNEDVFKDVKELDMMKLRVGWGQTGNSAIGGGFQYVDLISDATWFSPVFGDNQTIAAAQYAYQTIAAKEIHWESAEMLNAGLDVVMFSNKLTASLEYYVKRNNDLLVKRPIPLAMGYLPGKTGAQPWTNSGKIVNNGVEISVQWRDIIGDFSYGLGSNFTTIKNTVNYLPVPSIISSNANNKTIEGHSIGALYGYVDKGIIQLTDEYYAKDANNNFTKDVNGNYTGYKFGKQEGVQPQPGDIRYQDSNADGVIDATDRTLIGKTIPSISYTFSFECSYKSFDFNVFFNGVSGFDIYNAQLASLSTIDVGTGGGTDGNKLNDFAINHWTEANASATHVRVDLTNKNKNSQISTFWIEDGSFLRIKDLQFGYTLSDKICKSLSLGNLRVYANASNVYNFTKYKGKDPEGFMSNDPLMSGTDNGSYVTPRSVTLGLQIGF